MCYPRAMTRRRRRYPRHHTAPGRPWGIIEADAPTDWKAERKKVRAFLGEAIPGCVVMVGIMLFAIAISTVWLFL